MNKTEARYAKHLELSRQVGEIATWRFECLRFKLAEKTYYNPDFMVILPNGLVELHEVKGFFEDDARVKIKVVAEMYPEFAFIAVMEGKNGYEYEHFKCDEDSKGADE
jgi:hypothetical protein